MVFCVYGIMLNVDDLMLFVIYGLIDYVVKESCCVDEIVVVFEWFGMYLEML